MALFRIKRQNINESALNIDKFDATVQNQISVESIQAVYDSVNLAAPAITSVAYANSSYTVLDDTASNVSGGYIVITGAGFQSGAQITIGSDSATSVTHVNSSTIRAQIPAKDAGSYHLTLINPTGGISILVNGITYSNTPVWGTAGTLDNQAVDTSFAVTLSANSDSNVTYSNTTTLPTGTALLSNGYFYGTITGIEAETTYNFTVAAIDEELQDNPREFSVTVTVAPPPGSLWSWGIDENGSLGLSSAQYTYKSSPTQVGTFTTWTTVKKQYQSSAAIKDDGTLWTWGWNNSGQLGLGNTTNRNSPNQVGALTNWKKVSVSRNLMVAIKTDGTLWAWGVNSAGSLGLNTRADKSSPSLVSSDEWLEVEAIDSMYLAIKSDGTLWATGYNLDYGQLGLNDRISRSSPVQVGTSYWSSISSWTDHVLAIKTDGTLWAWGRNDYGQLGLQNLIHRSSPVQVGGDNNWSKVSCGETHSGAIKTDKTLWMFGWNNDGGLGLGNTTFRSSPTQVGTDTNWDILESGRSRTFAIRDDSTGWAWGSGTNGQLGLNNTSNRNSPTQITGSWQSFAPGDGTTAGIKKV
jgi:alpha-tubulin suppressor-like RCC1 family protein